MNSCVLIIEDRPVPHRNRPQDLEGEGWNVQWADSALDGLEMLEASHPDAVVLDFKLPDVDGLQALARIQALQSGAHVVMVAGEGSIELAVRAMKDGAIDISTRPALRPLRGRGDDVLRLARHFLQLHAARYGKAVPELAADAQALLKSYPWPGHVSELRQVIEQAVLLSRSNVLHAENFDLDPSWAGPASAGDWRVGSPRNFGTLQRGALDS